MLASTNINQSAPNLVQMCMNDHKSSDEFGKFAEYDFVLTLASTNINQSTPNLVKMYVIIRSQMSLIMDPIGFELSELSALEFGNLPYLTLFQI